MGGYSRDYVAEIQKLQDERDLLLRACKQALAELCSVVGASGHVLLAKVQLRAVIFAVGGE